jgi:RNA polymerase sigma-70 factor (ECF subfamily)
MRTGMVSGELARDGAQDNTLDLELVERVLREGTPEALRPLYERYKDRVYNTAYRVTGDPEVAEDVTHDVFVRVYERLRQFRRRSRFSSWLYRVTVNLATDVARRRGRERWLFAVRFGVTPGSREPMTARESGPLRSAESAEAAEEVSRAVAELSPKLRSVVALRYFEGLSYEEVAEVLEVSVGTVKSRLSRAHKRLSVRLERFHPSPASE